MFRAVDEEANDCTFDIRSIFLAVNVIDLYLRCCEDRFVRWVEDMEDGPNLRPDTLERLPRALAAERLPSSTCSFSPPFDLRAALCQIFFHAVVVAVVRVLMSASTWEYLAVDILCDRLRCL